MIVAVTGQMMKIRYYVDNLGEQPILVVSFLASITWAVGWITLMTCHVNSQPHPDSLRFTKIARKVDKLFGWINRPFRRYPRLIYVVLFVVITLIITFGILAVNSYYGKHDFYYQVPTY